LSLTVLGLFAFGGAVVLSPFLSNYTKILHKKNAKRDLEDERFLKLLNKLQFKDWIWKYSENRSGDIYTVDFHGDGDKFDAKFSFEYHPNNSGFAGFACYYNSYALFTFLYDKKNREIKDLSFVDVHMNVPIFLETYSELFLSSLDVVENQALIREKLNQEVTKSKDELIEQFGLDANKVVSFLKLAANSYSEFKYLDNGNELINMYQFIDGDFSCTIQSSTISNDLSFFYHGTKFYSASLKKGFKDVVDSNVNHPLFLELGIYRDCYQLMNDTSKTLLYKEWISSETIKKEFSFHDFMEEHKIEDSDIRKRLDFFEEKFILIRQDFLLLNIEEKHTIQNTILNDLKELLIVYMELSDKQKLLFKERLFHSFDILEGRMDEIEKAIDEKKLAKFSAKTEVISKR